MKNQAECRGIYIDFAVFFVYNGLTYCNKVNNRIKNRREQR